MLRCIGVWGGGAVGGGTEGQEISFETGNFLKTCRLLYIYKPVNGPCRQRQLWNLVLFATSPCTVYLEDSDLMYSGRKHVTSAWQKKSSKEKEVQVRSQVSKNEVMLNKGGELWIQPIQVAQGQFSTTYV